MKITETIPPLKLSLQMLVDELTEREYEPKLYNPSSDRQKLTTIQMYYGQDDLLESSVYLCTDQMLLARPVDNHDIFFIVTGEDTPPIRALPNPLLFLPDAHPSEILNLVNILFCKYRKFEMDLYEALYTGGLSDLCSTALAFLKNPIQIHDEKFMLLSRPQYVSGMTDVDYNENTGISSFKIELINTLKRDPDYIKTLSARKAGYWIKPLLTPYRVAYVNIFDRSGKYRGRILINELNSIMYPSHLQILEFLASFVTIAITNRKQNVDSSYMSFELLLQKYLHGDPPARETTVCTLSMHKWQEHDSYICAKIRVPRPDRRINSVHIILSSLMLLFANSSLFADGDDIWLVENLSANHMEYKAFRRKLEQFAADGSYYVGQSSVFQNFFFLPHAYEQASISLKTGRETRPQAFCYAFEECINPYLISKICRDERKETLCHEQLLNLLEYDREKNTDYYHTLRVYLTYERSLTAVSQILHIHRSTLQYRIAKLSEIINLPLDDAELRYYLLTCFRILDSSDVFS